MNTRRLAVVALLSAGLALAPPPMPVAAQDAEWVWALAREIRDPEPARALHLMARAARLADTPEMARVIAADAYPLLPHLRAVPLPVDGYAQEAALSHDGSTAFVATSDGELVRFSGLLPSDN